MRAELTNVCESRINKCHKCIYIHIYIYVHKHSHTDTHTQMHLGNEIELSESKQRTVKDEGGRLVTREQWTGKESKKRIKIQPGRKCTMDRESRLSTTFKCTRCSVLRVCPTQKFSQLHLCLEGYLKAVSSIRVDPAHNTQRIRIRMKSPAWASLAAATCRHSLLAVHLLR